MRLPRLLTVAILSGSLGLASITFPVASRASFTSANSDTKLDINSIDIAPTNTPIPTIKPNRKPTPKIVQPEKKSSSIRQGDAILPEKKFFTLSLSATAVDFGTIDVTNPVIRTHKVDLDPGTAKSYSLLAYENHPLRIGDDANTFIPDTTCDDGNCTESIASDWQNTLTYGLGLRCDEDDEAQHCLPEYEDQQYYKQFADLSRKETGTNLLSGYGQQGSESRITYKVNVAGTQKQGLYANVLVFIAAPGY